MTHARELSVRRAPLTLHAGPAPIFLREIGVVGPGVVGMPIAALLATAELWAPDGAPTRVTVVQRASASSGWKVGAINAGRSPIGALEPALDELVGARCRERPSARDDGLRRHPRRGRRVRLRADGAPSDDARLRAPARGAARRREGAPQRTAGSVPIVVVESTLAPTTLATVVRPLFAQHGLEEGRDVLLAHSPSRVTRGDVVGRLLTADKLVGALSPGTALPSRRCTSTS